MAHILVIDNEAEMVKVVCEVLERDGHQILTATDVNAGMLLFDDNPIDLVLTNMTMADGGGLEIIKQVRSRALTTKMVAMSGVGQARLTKLLQTDGVLAVDAILMKPFSIQRLLDVVNKVLTG